MPSEAFESETVTAVALETAVAFRNHGTPGASDWTVRFAPAPAPRRKSAAVSCIPGSIASVPPAKASVNTAAVAEVKSVAVCTFAASPLNAAPPYTDSVWAKIPFAAPFSVNVLDCPLKKAPVDTSTAPCAPILPAPAANVPPSTTKCPRMLRSEAAVTVAVLRSSTCHSVWAPPSILTVCVEGPTRRSVPVEIVPKSTTPPVCRTSPPTLSVTAATGRTVPPSTMKRPERLRLGSLKMSAFVFSETRTVPKVFDEMNAPRAPPVPSYTSHESAASPP